MPRWTPFEPYFWSLVSKSAGCWEWTGNALKGYGRVHFNGKREAAHRVSWMLKNGEIPSGLYVCHHCDNRQCVRPDHLFIGTQKDNMQDWTRKGKNVLINNPISGDNHWTKNEEARARISSWRKKAYAEGRIAPVQDAKTGRLNGWRGK